MDLNVISVRTKVCQRPLNLDSRILVLSTCIARDRIVRRFLWGARVNFLKVERVKGETRVLKVYKTCF